MNEIEDCRKFLREVSSRHSVNITTLSSGDIDWFAGFFNRAFEFTFADGWPESRIDLGELYLFGANEIREKNELDSELLKDGLLLIGSALDGDLLVVDIETSRGAVGYVEHERFWEQSETRAVFAVFNDSLRGFFSAANNEDNFPIDYEDARIQFGEK